MSDIFNVFTLLFQMINEVVPGTFLYIAAGFLAFLSFFRLIREVK